MTIQKLYSLLGKMIASGNGRRPVCIDKRTFTHALEDDGCCIMDVDNLYLEFVDQLDDDGGMKCNKDGSQSTRHCLILTGDAACQNYTIGDPFGEIQIDEKLPPAQEPSHSQDPDEEASESELATLRKELSKAKANGAAQLQGMREALEKIAAMFTEKHQAALDRHAESGTEAFEDEEFMDACNRQEPTRIARTALAQADEKPEVTEKTGDSTNL